MNIGSFHFKLSERQQVAVIIVVALLAIFLIWHILLRPQGRARRENEAMRRRLEQSDYRNMSIEGLKATERHYQGLYDRLWNEWQRTTARLATFANEEFLRKSEIGRIDFKVELFHTRQRLRAKSEALGIRLVPTDLGMPDAVMQNDEARVLMLQLRSVEKLADLTLDRRIERLLAIKPLPPVTRRDRDGNPLFDEYPVRVEFEVGYENLYRLFQAVFEPHQIFVFRHIHLQSGATPEAPLRIKAVMSALLFEEPQPPSA